MARRKPNKNPKVTDEQRQKVLTDRIIEERAKAEERWKWNKSETTQDKVVDYLEGTTIEDHITHRILRGVVFGMKHGAYIYPKTPEEKYFDRLEIDEMYHITRKIRQNKKYNYLSLGTDSMHENPITKDIEPVVFDFGAEQKRRYNKKSVPLTNWEQTREQYIDTMNEITSNVTEIALVPESERKKRAADERRRRRNNNSGEGA